MEVSAPRTIRRRCESQTHMPCVWLCCGTPQQTAARTPLRLDELPGIPADWFFIVHDVLLIWLPVILQSVYFQPAAGCEIRPLFACGRMEAVFK